MEQLLVKDWMTTDPITVEPETTLPAAYHLMKLNRIRRLPVVDSQGKLVGIVTLGDIREARPKESTALSIWELHSMVAGLEVREFMSPQPITVTPDTPIRQAAQLMLQHKIGGLPVVDQGRLVGIITDSDIFRLLVERLPEIEAGPATPA
ncbi:MAG: CBS domain-containing protein [Chloroflexi bacterium]|nr:MAG: CBS domain-containing protein [Chloroflexota bacterium]